MKNGSYPWQDRNRWATPEPSPDRLPMTEGDARAELAPLHKKLERLGEEARGVGEALVTRAKELGRPELASVPDADAAIKRERKLQAQRDAAYANVENLRARVGELQRGIDLARPADAYGGGPCPDLELAIMSRLAMGKLVPLRLSSGGNVRAGELFGCVGSPQVDVRPRLLIVTPDMADGVLQNVIVGCQMQGCTHDAHTELSLYTPESWGAGGMKAMAAAMAFPGDVANPAVCVSVQVCMRRDYPQGWHAVMMCELIPPRQARGW